MIFRLETGYFVWNFFAWAGIFFFSALFFCLFIYLRKTKVGGYFIKEEQAVLRDVNGSARNFENKVSDFKEKSFDPWLEKPFCHALTIVVLFVLFMIAIFSGVGVE